MNLQNSEHITELLFDLRKMLDKNKTRSARELLATYPELLTYI